MDISFFDDNKKFNYRACAVIVDNERILAMKDGNSPYYYLPGGRVKIGERAEDAVIRECREELGENLEITRPLWLNQAFFTEDVEKTEYHELCIYFLMDISKSDILLRGNSFVFYENQRKNSFEWISFKELKDKYFYPKFLKKDIFDLPERFSIRTEFE